uniref:Uncharacterized protein n=1 Tax=Chlorella vulgaris TaxID=3077 RepID=A0A8A2F450_CHLVU|nr:hypothetical protein [Chlorella vulgaris]
MKKEFLHFLAFLITFVFCVKTQQVVKILRSRTMIDFGLEFQKAQIEMHDNPEDRVRFVDAVNLCLPASDTFFQNPDRENKFSENYSIKLIDTTPHVSEIVLQTFVKEILSLSNINTEDTLGKETLGKETYRLSNLLKKSKFGMESHHRIHNNSEGPNTFENGLGISTPKHGIAHFADAIQRFLDHKGNSSSNTRAAGARVEAIREALNDRDAINKSEEARKAREEVFIPSEPSKPSIASKRSSASKSTKS